MTGPFGTGLLYFTGSKHKSFIILARQAVIDKNITVGQGISRPTVMKKANRNVKITR